MAFSTDPLVFVTDCEGNLNVLKRALTQSGVANDQGEPTRKFRFVFGGDATTRGTQDLQMMDFLDQLHQHPMCSMLSLIGNRELMLYRFPDSLHPTRLTRSWHDLSFFWLSGKMVPPSNAEELAHQHSEYFQQSPNPLPLEELRSQAKAALDLSGSSALSSAALAAFHQLAVVRCKCMLQYTMGSPNSFELRRKELKHLGRSASDYDVVKSFLELIAPDGQITQYCLRSHVAFIDESSHTLFVHGSVSSNDIVSQINGANSENLDLRAWIDGYNSAMQSTFLEYVATYDSYQQLLFDEYFANGCVSGITFEEKGGFGYSPMHDAVMVGMAHISRDVPSFTPIYSSWVSFYKPGVELKLDQRLEAKLLQADVESIVCGHNPHGDGTITLRFDTASGHPIRVHCVDNAYAGNTQFAAADAARPHVKLDPSTDDPRGDLSVSAFTIDENGRKVLVGTMSNGVQYSNLVDETLNPQSKWIGSKATLQLPQASIEVIIKFILHDGTFVGAETNGYTITNYRLRLGDEGQFSVLDW